MRDLGRQARSRKEAKRVRADPIPRIRDARPFDGDERSARMDAQRRRSDVVCGAVRRENLRFTQPFMHFSINSTTRSALSRRRILTLQAHGHARE